MPYITNAPEIIAAADILEIARRYIPGLRHQGANWVARCPFHGGRGESFKVSPNRGTWRCWSRCDTGGDALALLFAHHRLDPKTDFVEAVELLAEEVGIPVRYGETEGGNPHPPGPTRAELHAALATAHAHYRTRLAENEPAIEYLQGRGFAKDVANDWEFGYAHGNSVAECGAPPNHLVAAGVLVRSRQSDVLRDPLAGRVLIPLRNHAGRLVGFAGRSLPGDDSGPKYLNTCETRLYHKRDCLFGYSRAARMSGPVLVLEGQLKLIAAQLADIRAVAVGGCSFSPSQAALLARLEAPVHLAQDADEAGRAATIRAAAACRQHGMEVGVASLVVPSQYEGDRTKVDPDDLLAAACRVAYSHEDFLPWIIRIATDGLDAVAAARAVSAMVMPILADQPDPIVRLAELATIASLTGIPQATLEGAAPPPPPPDPPMAAPLRMDDRMTPGRLLLSALLQAPDVSPAGEPDTLWWVELVDWLHLPLALVQAIRIAARVRDWAARHQAPIGVAAHRIAGQWAEQFIYWLAAPHEAPISEQYILALQDGILAERIREFRAAQAAQVADTGDLSLLLDEPQPWSD
jgi:DNA primase